MDTTFTDQQTKIVAAWLNDVNVAVYRALGAAGIAPTTAAAVVTNLKAEIISQLAISTYIQTLFPAGTAAVARATLGSTTVGDAVFIAASTGAAQDAIGGTATGKSLFTAASVAAALSALGARAKLQVFTATSTYTPTTGMTACLVLGIGGGGAGGGAPATVGGQVSVAGGGGSGCLCISVFTAAQIGVSKAVTIGTGGVGTSGGSIGGSGTETILLGLLDAPGGTGGLYQGPVAYAITSGAGSGQEGGTSFAGQVFMPGQAGYPSYADPGATAGGGIYGVIGNGASTLLGGGGMSGAGSGATPGYGGGGRGAVNGPSTAATTGQNGGPGIMLILEFF